MKPFTGVELDYAGRNAPIDFVTADGKHAVEVTQLTSGYIRELLSVPPLESSRLSCHWLVALDAPTLGAPHARGAIPNLREVGKDLVPLLAQCEDLGIADPIRFRPTVTAAGEYREAEPRNSIMSLLGRQRTISCRPFSARGGSGSVRLVPIWGGFVLTDADDFVAALGSLPAEHAPLKRHVEKVKRQEATHRVLILVPDSSWPPAWNLNFDDGFDAVPTLQLGTHGDIDIWIIASDGAFVWIHDATGWHQLRVADESGAPV